MAARDSKATVSKGRESYCVVFRHPVVKAPDGRGKLRVRRGLGTRDESEAARRVEQMNEILSNSEMHTVAARGQAAAKYHEIVVDAFYSYMEPIAHNAWAERHKVIPLPGAEQGYAKAMAVGTTASGKTTLLRQVMGTDPESERFPSTSAAKTTTADIEVVLADGRYEAVVSFIPHDHVRLLVSDCVVAAVSGYFEGEQPAEIVRRFVEHSDQRFRLNYLLGSPTIAGLGEQQEEDAYDDDEEPASQVESEMTDEDRSACAAKMQSYLSEIESLGDEFRDEIERAAKDLDVDLSHARPQDRDAIRDLVEERLLQGPQFDALIDTLMDDIEERFGFAGAGEYVPGKSGWPVVWKFATTDRKEFIRTVNRFSSNYAPNFGRLLTPIVDGIRVCGPFRPAWVTGDTPKIVLLDGQGIGHTADSTASISTTITRRFRVADAIILVDNAAQPMQAGSVSVLRSLVTSGHESKLVVCFTHFDDVKGDNLPTVRAKRDHVTGSFFNAVHALGQQLGREAEQSLQRLMNRLVFVASIDKPVGEGTRTAAELRHLTDMVEKSIAPLSPVELRPVYDIANLVLAIQRSTQSFHQRWRGLLTSEHWARIKALTRRVGVFNQDEYDQLRPVADLIAQLQAFIHTFLAQPIGWEPPIRNDERLEDKTRVTDSIRQSVSDKLHDLARRRLVDTRNKQWSAAFYRRGRGSTVERGRDIKSIYDSAAPIPAEMADEEATQFMFDVRIVVAESIKEHNGVVKGWEP